MLSLAGVSVGAPDPATDAELELVHDPAYIAAVRRASGPDGDASALRYGLGTPDDPVFYKGILYTGVDGEEDGRGIMYAVNGPLL